MTVNTFNKIRNGNYNGQNHLQNSECYDGPDAFVVGQCPECGYKGMAGAYSGINSYYECPECDEEIIVNY